MQSLSHMCIEICNSKSFSKKYIIGNKHRPPCDNLDDFTKFHNEFLTFLSYANNLKREVYLCGDFNINLLKSNYS